MSNKMSTVFIGYIVEKIYKNGKPTLELRVRVPSVHGANSRSGLKDTQLPIAKPLILPGVEYNPESFEEMTLYLQKVYVIFESGDIMQPVYFGLKGNSELYDLPSSSVFIRLFPSTTEFPAIGSTAYLYRAEDTGALYAFDASLNSYTLFITTASVEAGDSLVGTVKYYTDIGPAFGLRVIDGYETVSGDTIFVYDIPNGIVGLYAVTAGNWTKLSNVFNKQVVSIEHGVNYGGTMLKALDGSVLIVKKSEQTKWQQL